MLAWAYERYSKALQSMVYLHHQPHLLCLFPVVNKHFAHSLLKMCHMSSKIKMVLACMILFNLSALQKETFLFL